MFEFNPLEEPRKGFEPHKPPEITSVKVYFPGDPGYHESAKVLQLEQPFGFIYCLNLKRRAEFALMSWLENIPDSEEAQTLLTYIMLTQDYIFDTTSVEPGYTNERENKKADELFKELKALTDQI